MTIRIRDAEGAQSEYPTRTAAAAALGISYQRLLANLRGPQPKMLGSYEGWSFTETSLAGGPIRYKRPGRPGVPLWVYDPSGTKSYYNSIQEASDALGIPQMRVWRYLNGGGKGEWSKWVFQRA